MASTSLTPITGRVTVSNGQITTTTQDIADVYGKRHDNVYRIVRQRISEAGEWGVLNFEDTPYTNPQNGQTYPVIRMTKKGFHFVVGKFTGAKAVAHQIAFADEFERMEAALQAPIKAVATVVEGLDDMDLLQLEAVIKHLRARHDLSVKMLRDAVLTRFGAPSFAHIPRSRFQEVLAVLREFAPAPQPQGTQVCVPSPSGDSLITITFTPKAAA